MNDILIISKNGAYNNSLKSFLSKVDSFDIINATDLSQAKNLIHQNSIVLIDPSLVDEYFSQSVKPGTPSLKMVNAISSGDAKERKAKVKLKADTTTVDILSTETNIGEQLFGASRYPFAGANSFFIKNGKKREVIPFDNITWLEAEGNYTYIHTITTKYVLKKPLRRIIITLDERFAQCHKKYCVNINSVTLKNNQDIPLTYFYKKDFTQKIYGTYKKLD